MLCRICKTKDAHHDDQTNADWLICLDCYSNLKSTPKTHLILLDSDKFEFGLVLWDKNNCGGSTVSPDALPVGTWGLYTDKTVWISVSQPLDALIDMLTNMAGISHAERQTGSFIGKRGSDLFDKYDGSASSYIPQSRPQHLSQNRSRHQSQARQPRPEEPSTISNLRNLLSRKDVGEDDDETGD